MTEETNMSEAIDQTLIVARELREAISTVDATKERIAELEAELRAANEELYRINEEAKANVKKYEAELWTALNEQWDNGLDVDVVYDFAGVRATTDLIIEDNAVEWLVANHPSLAAKMLTVDKKQAKKFAQAGVFGEMAPVRTLTLDKPVLSKGKLP
jgi:seryl-tRNA synthetase